MGIFGDVGNFIQDQVFGMKWLNVLIGNLFGTRVEIGYIRKIRRECPVFPV